jgi:hypothetical protein
MKFKYQNFSQKQLGSLCGVSSHEIGKWLVKLGLRDEKTGKPTREAHHDGLCDTVPSGQTGYCWAWNVQKVVERFMDAGHSLLTELPEELVEAPLHGPFRLNESCPKEVLNADGTLAVWASCRRNAEAVMRLLAFADKRGVINKLMAEDVGAKEG